MTTWRVEFPKPCSESWDGMNETERGRHCDKCKRVVHDLASYTPEEASALIDREPGSEECARAVIGPDGLVQTRPSPSGMVLALALGLPLVLSNMAASAATLPQSDAYSYEENAHSGIVMTVVDLTGQPVAGTLVVLHKIDEADPDDYAHARDAANNIRTTTDASGKTPPLFLLPGNYTIFVLGFRGFSQEVEIKPHALLIQKVTAFAHKFHGIIHKHPSN
jgi:hypothetical protein